nr:hypothetical protein [Tanacetum cinerariifolium]
MEVTSGWKGRPDGRDVRIKGMSVERDVKMEGRPEWKGSGLEAPSNRFFYVCSTLLCSGKRMNGKRKPLSTLQFLKFPENIFEVLKLLENSVEVLKILENKLKSLKLQENQPVDGLENLAGVFGEEEDQEGNNLSEIETLTYHVLATYGANEEMYPDCDYVTRLYFMAKFTYFKAKDANKDVHFCSVCNTSRWKDSNTPGKKVPKKVLRYFPIIPRLQRLYKSSHNAKEMTWHAIVKCTEPGKMQHLVDGRAWKDFDTKYSDFAVEPRNVRLGLAADGFNPFGNLKSSFMLTLIIPRLKSSGKDIDVYLRPLIDDLKDLWVKTGVETIDIATGLKFNMRAMMTENVGNKKHKAFPLPVIEFSLAEEVPTASEESCHCQKKIEATAVKIALLSKSRRNCQSKSNDSYVNKYKTAQELWAVILKTFGGNEATKNTKKNLLKQQYGNFKAEGAETLDKMFNKMQVIVSQLQFMDVEIEQDDLNQKFLTSLAPEWLMHTIVWRNRSDLDTMSLDDLYNHLKVYESEVKKKSEPNSQNIAFISSAKHSRGNEDVNTASVSTASTNVPTGSANVGVASISQDTACTYISFQSSGSQIKFEDINQIDEDDMEEMDIKWNMALLSMRADKFWKKTGKKISIQGSDVARFDKLKVECFNCHKMGHFSREFRAPRSQDRGRRDNYRQGSKVEEQASKALMANGKLAGFQIASKDLDNLFESQRLDKNKKGLGYSAVPPPLAQLYSSLKMDLSWTGLPEFKDDTMTDYSRPAPIVESFPDDAQNRNPSVTKVASPVPSHLNLSLSLLRQMTVQLKEDARLLAKELSKPNSVLFTDSECIVLGLNFKLSDDDNVLLRTPRQHNMYSIDLNNIVPHKDLTCLVAKASADECMLWHKRLGKQHKASCKSKLVNSVSKPLHTLHMDLFGPTSDLKVKIIRCDNGGEFKNKEMNNFCSQKGIKREFSNAKTPQRNGVVKRRNRTLIEASRTMLADAKLLVTFWAEAVNTACYVQNRVLVNKSQNKTPYELFNGRTPAIGFLKPFGCHVMILNTLDNLGKFEAKGMK